MGKTALALVAAHQAMAEDWFGGGVFFIDLRGYTPDPCERVPATAAAGQLLRAMGIRDTDLPPTGEEQLGLYRSMLEERARKGRAVLVVADNAATTGQVEPLLPAQPCHRLLVTSRHILALPAHLVDLAVLPEADAVDLLGTALEMGRADPRVAAEPGPAKEIGRLCGRLPLALQIIAALLRAEPGRPLADVAAELADAHHRLDALDSGDRDPYGRPLAVRAAFDLSYQHLLADQPEQARLFRLLPLNPGPDISLPAAAALADTSEPVVRRHLAALARAHLLTTPVAGRWGMHDLVRLYAGQHGLSQAVDDQREQALDRLLGHYLDTAEFANAHLRALSGQPVPDRFTGRDDALAWFGAERANLVTAVAVAHAAGRHQIASCLSACLNVYLSWRRALDDLLTVSTIAAAAASQLGDRRGEGGALNNLGLALRAVRRFEEAITVHRNAVTIYRELSDRHGEGQALNNLGNALQEVRRFGEAITVHRNAVTIYRELGDRHGESGALNNLGLDLRELRRFEEAVTAHQDAVALCRGLGDRRGEGQALNNLGLALQEVRRFGGAITAHRAAATIYRDLGDRHSEGTALNNLGLALQEVRRFEVAIIALRAAATLHRDLGDRQGEGLALNNLGLVLRRIRRFEEAIAAHQQDLRICRDLGDRHGEGRALNNLGLALHGSRRWEEAITTYQDAVVLCRDLGDRHGEGRALNNLGLALQEVRQFGEAITVLQQCLHICRDLGDRHGEGQALNNLGLALRESRRCEEAIATYQDAAAIHRDLGDRHGQGLALNNLGLALHDMGRVDEAIIAFKRALTMFDSMKDDHILDFVRAKLTAAQRQRAEG
ncbi:Putative regulatory protein [[Actinomadura] parvosata subsp. kistnae]|nr:Putative regulatory protein [Actinomadura parvosata subsp. kistnae]